MISESLAAGGFFEDGEVLLKIDRREYELAVVRARAAIAQAELKLATEEEEAAVARMEWESLGQGEPPPLVVRAPQIAEAEAMLASAEAAFEQAEYDLERTVVKAPYAGRVREKRVDVGQFVSRGSSIARLYSVDYAEVRLPIPDKDLAYVNLPLAYRGQKERAAGPRVTLMANFAGKRHRWQGRIVRTEGEIDPRTRMVQAIAQVDDPYGRARPGRRHWRLACSSKRRLTATWLSAFSYCPGSFCGARTRCWWLTRRIGCGSAQSTSCAKKAIRSLFAPGWRRASVLESRWWKAASMA